MQQVSLLIVCLLARSLLYVRTFSVPIPLRGLTYCEGIRTGSDKDFEKMLEMYQRETVQVEKERLLSALTCSRDPHTLKK
jgi:hypothetical protein